LSSSSLNYSLIEVVKQQQQQLERGKEKKRRFFCGKEVAFF